jgi:hypothetical protein
MKEKLLLCKMLDHVVIDAKGLMSKEQCVVTVY